MYLPHIKQWFEEKWHFLTENKIHEDLKQILLQDKKLNEITWVYETYTKSTATMTKIEYMNYLKDVDKYMIDTHEIIIPPHEFSQEMGQTKKTETSK